MRASDAFRQLHIEEAISCPCGHLSQESHALRNLVLDTAEIQVS